MKTKFRNLFILTLFLGFSSLKSNAQTLMHFWDFNQTIPLSGSGHDSLGTTASYLGTLATDSLIDTWPLNANQTVVTSTVTPHILYSRPQKVYSSNTSDGLDSILDNGTPGAVILDYSNSNDSNSLAAGNLFIRARNPSDSCTFTIFIPTDGYKNVTLDFALSASSSKGADYLLFSYSTNGGTSWNKLTQAIDTFNQGGVRTPDSLLANNSVTSVSSWYPVHLDFSSDVNVNNNPNFVVQFMIAGVNTTLGSGNTRFDNFAVKGTVASGINELSAQNAGYSIYPNPSQDYVTINSTNYKGSKTITVYDVLGQTVSVSQNNKMQTMLNTSSLNSGIYFVDVKELTTGNKYTMKLVKE